MTTEEFCKLYTRFHGDEIDNIAQLKMQRFTGEELYEFCDFVIKNRNKNFVTCYGCKTAKECYAMQLCADA